MIYTIEARDEQLQALAEQLPANTPFVMLNLLRYRAQANYPVADQNSLPSCDVSGAEAYRRYSRAAAPLLHAAGGEVIWFGDAKSMVIGPEQEDWHQVMMVRYPHVAAFLEMICSRAYREAVVHRMAALQDSRLIATLPK